MAASDSNAVAAQTANSFSGDHHPPVSCLDDPNFATICSFIQNFGEIVRIGHLPFDELQQWLENTSDGKNCDNFLHNLFHTTFTFSIKF